MKNASAYGRRLVAFLRKLQHQRPVEPPPKRDEITQLVIGFLEWNATARAAQIAYEKLSDALVDNNDLRVSHPDEVVAIIGERYPLAVERAARLHDVLQEIFDREHAVTLQPLAAKSKKDLRDYLMSLPGMTPYVAALVTLVSFTGHAVPVDDNLVQFLRHEDVVDPEATPEEIAAFLEHHVKAGEALEVHQRLRSWADHQAGRAHEGHGAGKHSAKHAPAKRTK